MTEIEKEMAELIMAFAKRSSISLVRPLATAEEANRVSCPMHGPGSCYVDYDWTGRGCLFRQIEALRADWLPPRCEAATGEVGSEGCETT